MAFASARSGCWLVARWHAGLEQLREGVTERLQIRLSVAQLDLSTARDFDCGIAFPTCFSRTFSFLVEAFSLRLNTSLHDLGRVVSALHERLEHGLHSI